MGKRLTVNETSNKTLKENATDYVLNKRVHGLSTQTVDYYEYCIDKFLEDIAIINPGELNQEDINRYIQKLKSSGIRMPSVNSKLNSIRGYIKYLVEKKMTADLEVPKQKEQETVKDTYSEADLKKLLEKPNMKKCGYTEYRSWVIVNFLLSVPLRNRSLNELKIRDIDFDNNCVYVSNTKNKKATILPMSNTLTKILKEYIQVRINQGAESSDLLFISAYGEKLNRNSLGHSIKKYCRKRGVEREGSIHLFRHTYARFSIKYGVNAFQLQKILQHSTLDMTKKYVSLYTEDLPVNDFSPLEKLSSSKTHLKMK